VVTFNGYLYAALMENYNLQPDSSTEYWAVLTIVGPQGQKGDTGDKGDPGDPGGPPGPQGPQGDPGEVSAQQLSDSISGTANNPSGYGNCPVEPSNPPTQAELVAVIDWCNGLLGVLRR